MCGIAGFTDGGKNDALRRMIETLAHRGPDGSGLWNNHGHALGHARLSIIDLEGGAQPMSDVHGRRHIAFNGEIYNYRELRREFRDREFHTHSDTETILALAGTGAPAEEWVRRLDGMFAFALVCDGELLLARDPLGIKPLYTGTRDGRLVFSSELKAFPEGTKEIVEFPAGHVYSDRTGLRRFYDLRDGETDVDDPEEAARGILSRLDSAVTKRLIADVPVGVFLSGGLDSSLIAALARRHKDPLDTFSVGTADSPDRRYALEMSRVLGTRHHERVYTIEEAIEALPEVIYYLESFDCSLVRSAIPNYFLAKLASEHVKVSLSGEGADELFAGYEYLKQLPQGTLHEELRYTTLALHNTNLQRCDRMSMAHGLEVRVPFLDVAVVDWAFRIGTALKQHGPELTEKWVLRKAAEELLPADVAWRAKVKFAAGSGLGDRLAAHAEKNISEAEFRREREIAQGVFLKSREELLYYRSFRQFYPGAEIVPLVGRSRSV